MLAEKKHVFISFKTEDRKTARHFMKALKEVGFAVWWQEDIQCGQEWHGEIDKAIAEAYAIIVLWSNESMLSPWVRHEASQAIAKNIYVPVRIQAVHIQSPYDRTQASNMIGWAGNKKDGGLNRLFWLLGSLKPKPLPWWKRVARWIGK